MARTPNIDFIILVAHNILLNFADGLARMLSLDFKTKLTHINHLNYKHKLAHKILLEFRLLKVCKIAKKICKTKNKKEVLQNKQHNEGLPAKKSIIIKVKEPKNHLKIKGLQYRAYNVYSL